MSVGIQSNQTACPYELQEEEEVHSASPESSPLHMQMILQDQPTSHTHGSDMDTYTCVTGMVKGLSGITNSLPIISNCEGI